MKVLGLIPARGGSKGVPRKNIRLLGGKPLLQYTAESALNARSLSKVILSTDDEEIATIGSELGLHVPFLRPAELARDDTPTIDVVIDAVKRMDDQGESFDAICLLQPTTPFRSRGEIDSCIELLCNSGADCVFTVSPVPCKHNPHWVFFADKNGRLRLSTGEETPISCRQSLPDAYCRDGSVYATSMSVLTSFKTLYGKHMVGYQVDRPNFINIDELDDWAEAERILKDGQHIQNA